MFISVCGFSVLQQLVFGFRKKIQICFRIWIRYGFLFFLFGFRFIFDMSGNYAPPLISNSCETSACSACHNCIGSIWVLITGMWIFTVFTVLQAVFGLDRILCTRFAVWIEFFARNSQQFFTTIEPDWIDKELTSLLFCLLVRKIFLIPTICFVGALYPSWSMQTAMF